MTARPRTRWVCLGLVGLLLLSTPAHAVEYRLLVASIFEATLTSFVSAQELSYGASGPGLQRVEQSLNTGEMDWGAMPAGRPLTSVPDSVARAWGGVAVHTDVLRGGVDASRWDEVRWQGRPGERSIWLIRSTGNARPQSIRRLTLEGAGPVRQYQPYTFTGKERLAVVQMPQSLIAHYESRGTLWDKWVGRGLDLDREGIAAVVGRSSNAMSADVLYLIVHQGEQPTTYRTVISWDDRNIDREGIDAPVPMHSGRH